MIIIQNNQKNLLNRLKSLETNKSLGIAIIGEGKPDIPEPGASNWSRNALPSMAYGYNLRLTPLTDFSLL